MDGRGRLKFGVDSRGQRDHLLRRKKAYDYKLIDTIDGALTVSLKINDQTADDTFQRANITELVITPEGDFHAYNVEFASQFARTVS